MTSAIVVNTVGASASIISFVMLWPQAVRVFQQRHDPYALEGVSIATQLLILLNAALWGVYAVMTGAFWVGAPGLVNAPVAAICIALLLRARSTAALAGCGCDTEEPHKVFITAPPGFGSVMACGPESRRNGIVITDDVDVAALRASYSTT